MANMANSSIIMGAGPPPPNTIPNFVDPESIGYQVIILNTVMLTFSTAFVGLRLFTRLRIVKVVRLDDYVLLVAWALSIVLSALAIQHTKYGLGVHIWDVPIATFSPYWLRLNWIAVTFYFLITLLVKLSILTTYLNIHPGTGFRRAVWAVITYVVLTNAAAMFGNIFGCIPIQKSWDIMIEDGNCANALAFLLATGALNFSSDIAMIILPVPMLWALSLPWKEKIALMGVFMIASSVCVMSIVRIRYSIPAITSSDTTYSSVNLVLWTDLEIHTSLICASMPVLKPLLRTCFPLVFDSQNRTHEGSLSYANHSSKRAWQNSQNDGGYHVKLKDLQSPMGFGSGASEGKGIVEAGQDDESDWVNRAGSSSESAEHIAIDLKAMDATKTSAEYSRSENKPPPGSDKEVRIESGWDPLHHRHV